jgi:beta-glucosidase
VVVFLWVILFNYSINFLRKTMRNLLLFISVFVGILTKTDAQISEPKTPSLSKNTNAEVISAMKLEEKARLLIGMGMKMPAGLELPPPPPPTELPASDKKTLPIQGPVIGMGEDKVAGAAGTTAAFEQFGISKMVVADGPAGLRISPNRTGETRTFYATAFPIATLLASTWDVDLIYKTGEAMGNEVKSYGVDILLGPGMNIHRNALGGRNFEYFSEDPLVTGKSASAMVRGIQSNGVGTSIKHFAANNHETNRNTIDLKISPRAMREIYLRGFEIAVKEANPWTVMSSYNKINGVFTSESPDLLQKVLRQDWGFKGLVMTDWFGGSNAATQTSAGNELMMPGTLKQMAEIIKARQDGQLSDLVLNQNVEKMLDIIRASPSFKGYIPTNSPNLQANAAVARQAAAEGMILLKNNNQTLPIIENNTIAAFGNYSYDLISGGIGSGDVNEAYTISLPEGLKNAHFSLHSGLKTAYEGYILTEKAKLPKKRGFFDPPPFLAEMDLSSEILTSAASSDIAIITIGRIAGEGYDRKTTDDYYLSIAEQTLISVVSESFHKKNKKVVVLLNIGGVIETASWRDKVDAILLAWLPGQEAGNAIGDILSGKVNPSGKLATTFLKKYEDDPTAVGFPGKEFGDVIDLGFMKVRMAEMEYSEGIYVGYRAFDKQNIAPAYEFGYGLSYSNFEYSDIKLSDTKFKNKISITVSIKNTGKMAGKEVVELYLAAPQKTMDKPLQELKGFAKTKLLQPNETQVLMFELDARALTSFDEKMSAWVAEKGVYSVKMGASSRDIRLKKDFKLSKMLIVERVNRAFVEKMD